MESCTKNNVIITVATHNGVFHADDVFAVAVLQLALGGSELNIVRSRDPEVIATADIVVDVGATYVPEKKRFDHHQRGGAGTRENGVPYASAGLVWRHYGATVCGGDLEVAEIVEKGLIAPIDALDCGFALQQDGSEVVAGLRACTISNAISAFNPCWYEESDFNSAFMRAVDFARVVLERKVASARGTVLARGIVREAITTAEDPRLVILERFAPWLEVVVPEAPKAEFVLFPSEMGDWRIQAIPPTLGSFEKRRPLPESWAGKRGEELAILTGVSDAIFCHIGRFIGGATSKEGVLELARQALKG